MILTLMQQIRTKWEKLPNDRRRKGLMVLASYRGEDGNEYRKAFYCRTSLPFVPFRVTHEQAEALKYQGYD